MNAAMPMNWFRQSQAGVTLLRPQTIIDGQLLSVELEVPPSCAAPTLAWMGQVYKTYPAAGGRLQGLMPVRLATSAGEQKLVVACGSDQTTLMVPVTSGKFPESKLTVDPKFTQMPPPRVAQEQAAITDAFRRSEARRLWTQSFVPPSHEVQTSPYGVRRTFNGATKSRHLGLDFDGKVGQPIWAANDGVVVLAAKDFFYVGNAVFIDHGDKLYTIYFHMTELKVNTGDHVQRGQVIGTVGNTGRVTGPHVHMGVKLAGTYVNPADLLGFMPDGAEAAVADAPADPADR
jgi:murein DD-endopeptidase MepM/ murein hydrolase activator NlpD